MHELKWHSPLNIVYRRAAENGSLRSTTRLPQNELRAGFVRRLLAPPQKLLRRLKCICRYRRTSLEICSLGNLFKSTQKNSRPPTPSKRRMRALQNGRAHMVSIPYSGTLISSGESVAYEPHPIIVRLSSLFSDCVFQLSSPAGNG